MCRVLGALAVADAAGLARGLAALAKVATRDRSRTGGLALLWRFLLALAGLGALAPAASAQIFTYTGAEQSYVVPRGVSEVHVVAVGAPGADAPGPAGIVGGRAAGVSADLPIPTGQSVLYVEVGGTGVGFNGGGAPNGGDASDVRLLPRTDPNSIGSRVIVAAGGGGAGNYGSGGDAGNDGGGGSAGGKAGTATAGGAGGLGNPPLPCTNGQPGSLGQGGNATGFYDPSSYFGGGGGGYYGGGSGGLGGGPNCGPGSYETAGGGGGGGSSYVSPQATNTAIGLDQSRTPQVAITPDVITSSPPPVVVTPNPTPAVALTGVAVRPSRFALTGRRVGTQCLPVITRDTVRAPCTRRVAVRITYQLTAAAEVTFGVTRLLPGRLVGRQCRPPIQANRHRRACTRRAPEPGSLSAEGAAGTNSVTFNGRLAGRPLGPGSYILTATVRRSDGTAITREAALQLTR